MLRSFLSNWNIMRLLRLVLSIIIIVQSASTHDTAMTLAGIVFLGMALANVGCCGVGGCATPSYKKIDDKENKPVTYEEVV